MFDFDSTMYKISSKIAKKQTNKEQKKPIAIATAIPNEMYVCELKNKQQCKWIFSLCDHIM